MEDQYWTHLRPAEPELPAAHDADDPPAESIPPPANSRNSRDVPQMGFPPTEKEILDGDWFDNEF